MTAAVFDLCEYLINFGTMKFVLLVVFIGSFFLGFSQKNKLYHFIAKANRTYEKGMYEKSENYYLKVLTIDSLYGKAFVQLANISCEKSDFQTGISYINKAIQIENDNEKDEVNLAYLYSVRSYCFFHLDKTKESLEDLTQAIKFNGENANYYFMRSLIKRMLGDIKGCCQDLRKSSELGNTTASEYLTIYCLK